MTLLCIIVVPIAVIVAVIKLLLDGQRYYFLGDTDVLTSEYGLPENKIAVLRQIARERYLPSGGMMRSQTYVTERMYRRYLRKHPELI